MSRIFLKVAPLVALLLASCSDVPEDGGKSQTAAPAAAPATSAPAASVPATASAWTGDLSKLEATTLCSLDAVNGASASAGAFAVTTGQPMAFDGWVATPDMKVPDSFQVVLAGAANSFSINGHTGVNRDDVFRAYSAPVLQTAGFHIDLATASIPAGDYKLAIVQSYKGADVVCHSPTVLHIQ